MCMISFVGDFYHDKWLPHVPIQPSVSSNPTDITISEISRAEFDVLKKDVMDMKELLRRAKIYDEQNNQPDCHKEEKLKTLRKIAELVGINLDDVLGKPNAAP